TGPVEGESSGASSGSQDSGLAGDPGTTHRRELASGSPRGGDPVCDRPAGKRETAGAQPGGSHLPAQAGRLARSPPSDADQPRSDRATPGPARPRDPASVVGSELVELVLHPGAHPAAVGPGRDGAGGGPAPLRHGALPSPLAGSAVRRGAGDLARRPALGAV